MNTKEILTKAAQVIGITTSALVAEKIKAQPPGTWPEYDPGLMGSFAALLILSIIWIIVRNYNYKFMRTIWIVMGSLLFFFFLLTSFIYRNNKDKWVAGLPPKNPTEYYIVGDTLSKYGKDLKSNLIKGRLPIDNSHLIKYANGVESITLIWTIGSIEKVTEKLVDEYTLVIVLLSGAIFSLMEGAVKSGVPKL